MIITLVSENPAPWVMRKKKIYMYKFRIDRLLKHNQNATIRNTILQTIGQADINNYRYSVCAVLDRDKKQYTNSQFQNYEHIDIETAIDRHFEEYSIHDYQPYFKEFYVYVIQNFNQNEGGNDCKKNDCLYQVIFRAFNYDENIIPKEVRNPSKLKKYLQLERNAKVDIKHLEALEKVLNCSFGVGGDVLYISEDMKPKHINITLANGHYSFVGNGKSLAVNGIKYDNVAENNIYTYRYDDGKIIMFDGNSEEEISREQYNKLERDYYLLINCKSGDLQEARDKYISKAKYFYEKCREKINFFKSQYISKLNFKNILLRLQGTQQPDEISNFEAFTIDKIIRGGLMYYQKGIYHNVYDYDINTMYAYYLSNGKFTFPILKPQQYTLTNEEFKQWTCFQYGVYLCRPKSQHKFFKATTEFEWYSHFDLQSLELLGIEVELCEKKVNHLFYSANCRINGNLLKSYVDELYSLRQEVDDEYKQEIKTFLSCMYGSMCEKNKKTHFASADNIIDIGDDFINTIQPCGSGVLLETTCSQKIFKTDYARVAFITSYCKLKIIQVLKKYVENWDDIIAINTDGFTTKTKVNNLPIGVEIGQFKEKFYKSFDINRLNDIKKVE